MEKSNSNFEINCPICVDILIEPVTLPCDHTLCKPCFDDVLSKSAVCCPMCRKRIGTWARHATKDCTLIDEKKWSYIQKKHKDLVKARIHNKTPPRSKTEPKVNNCIQLAKTGEIRKEYEMELEKLRKAREEQERASQALIEKILQEDRIAFQKPAPAPKKKKPLQPSNTAETRVQRCESIDSITGEFSHHFKPIVRYPRTPPSPRDGRHKEVICPKSIKRIEFPSPSASSASTEIISPDPSLTNRRLRKYSSTSSETPNRNVSSPARKRPCTRSSTRSASSSDSIQHADISTSTSRKQPLRTEHASVARPVSDNNNDELFAQNLQKLFNNEKKYKLNPTRFDSGGFNLRPRRSKDHLHDI